MNDRHPLGALLGAISVLVIGAVVGVLLDRFVLLASPLEAQPPVTITTVQGDHAAALADLARSLELNDEQTAHMHRVFMRHQHAIDQAWTAMRQQMAAVIDTATAEIEVVLDPVQRDRLHAWILEKHGAPAHTPSSRRH